MSDADYQHIIRRQSAQLTAATDDLIVVELERDRAVSRCQDLEREVAALREENAWDKEYIRDMEENNVECTKALQQAEAHVAALVKAGEACRHGEAGSVRRWCELLDSPDLAALVKREQAREAVIEAAQSVAAQHPRNDHGLMDLKAALRALDAARPNTEGDSK